MTLFECTVQCMEWILAYMGLRPARPSGTPLLYPLGMGNYGPDPLPSDVPTTV
jgi:hypothetical protein